MHIRTRSSMCWLFCFFFQAEDGIRDLTVTGVQTCALPIYTPGYPQAVMCPTCRRMGPPGKFCQDCGSKLPLPDLFCPQCSEPVENSARFCPECGAKLQQAT